MTAITRAHHALLRRVTEERDAAFTKAENFERLYLETLATSDERRERAERADQLCRDISALPGRGTSITTARRWVREHLARLRAEKEEPPRP